MKSPKMPSQSQEEIDARSEARALNAKQMELIDAQKGEIAKRQVEAAKSAADVTAGEARRADAATGGGQRGLLSGNWSGFERAKRPASVGSLLGGGGFRRGGDLGAV